MTCAYWSIKQALNDSKFKTNVYTLEDLYLFSHTLAEQDLRINDSSDAGVAQCGTLSPVFTACSRNAKLQLPAQRVFEQRTESVRSQRRLNTACDVVQVLLAQDVMKIGAGLRSRLVSLGVLTAEAAAEQVTMIASVCLHHCCR